MRSRYIKLAAVIVVIFIVSLSVIAASIGGGSSNDANKPIITVSTKGDEIIAQNLSGKYGKSIEEIMKLKSELGDWAKVSLELIKSRNSLTEEQVVELYDKGYSPKDMEEAEKLAGFGNITPGTIIETKGKPGKESEEKSWQQVADELGMDIRQPAEKLGLTKQQIQELKNQGLSESQINDTAVLVFNYKKDYKEIANELKAGKKFKQLNDNYITEKRNSKEYREYIERCKYKKNLKIEEAIKTQLHMTDEDIELCRQNGVYGADIASVKVLSDQYGVTVSTVLNTKKNKNSWQETAKELGGGK